MPQLPLVSIVIPTFDRRDVVGIAIDCAIEQSYPQDAMEIIVVDDGSTDGTGELLATTYGDRIRYLRQPKGGVSSARNRGLAAARGEYIALLDPDDEWLPSKLAKQVAFLEDHPAIGMVVTDVVLMDVGRVGFEIVRRREQLPEDGWLLSEVMRQPSLAPSSAMFRRAVLTDVGGFDDSLPTAEDLDFHLRVALRWQIGVIEEPLTRQMRGHDTGLSALARTRVDIDVMERFVRQFGHRVDADDCDAALIETYTRHARGLFWQGDLAGALRCAAWGARRVRLSNARRFGSLGLMVAKGLAVSMRRQVMGA